MIRTGQIRSHSKWYIFENETPLLYLPHDNEFQAEKKAMELYPGARIVTTTDDDHPIHQHARGIK